MRAKEAPSVLWRQRILILKTESLSLYCLFPGPVSCFRLIEKDSWVLWSTKSVWTNSALLFFPLNVILCRLRAQQEVCLHHKRLSTQSSTAGCTYGHCCTDLCRLLLLLNWRSMPTDQWLPVSPPHPWQPPFHSDSMTLTMLDTSCKWSHALPMIWPVSYARQLLNVLRSRVTFLSQL